MKISNIVAVAAACLVVSPVAAQTAPPADLTVNGGATLTSDYRFRGLSQTNRDTAIQGTATVTHKSGVYVGTWASSIDDYVANGGDAEVDLFAGYKTRLGGTTVDGGLLYYYYPGTGGVKVNFFEPYLNATHTLGPVSAKVGVNAAWKQEGLTVNGRRRGGFYAYGELSAGIPTTPLTITGHVGHSFVSNYITFGDHYTDWSITGAYVWKQLTFSVGYVDTNRDFYSYPAGGGRNDKISGSGVVGAVSVAF